MVVVRQGGIVGGRLGRVGREAQRVGRVSILDRGVGELGVGVPADGHAGGAMVCRADLGIERLVVVEAEGEVGQIGDDDGDAGARQHDRADAVVSSNGQALVGARTLLMSPSQWPGACLSPCHRVPPAMPSPVQSLLYRWRTLCPAACCIPAPRHVAARDQQHCRSRAVGVGQFEVSMTSR
nr:hypothetical protein CFP56_01248 [Quercus suber]